MKSYYQTVDIQYLDTVYKIYQTMSFCPRLPDDVASQWNASSPPIQITDNDGIQTTWSPGGTVIRVLPDGTSMTWHPRPDLKTVLSWRCRGVYTEFGKNYVISRSPTDSYYWSSIETLAETKGTVKKLSKSLV